MEKLSIFCPTHEQIKFVKEYSSVRGTFNYLMFVLQFRSSDFMTIRRGELRHELQSSVSVVVEVLASALTSQTSVKLQVTNITSSFSPPLGLFGSF